MTTHVYAEQIIQNVQEGMQNNISRTPALFINEERYQNTWDTQTLLAEIILING
jgi:protein-disulfide isomerase